MFWIVGFPIVGTLSYSWILPRILETCWIIPRNPETCWILPRNPETCWIFPRNPETCWILPRSPEMLDPPQDPWDMMDPLLCQAILCIPSSALCCIYCWVSQMSQYHGVLLDASMYDRWILSSPYTLHYLPRPKAGSSPELCNSVEFSPVSGGPAGSSRVPCTIAGASSIYLALKPDPLLNFVIL